MIIMTSPIERLDEKSQVHIGLGYYCLDKVKHKIMELLDEIHVYVVHQRHST